MSFVSTYTQTAAEFPTEQRSNFRHLIFDIAGFGVLNGSAAAFLSVYAARLGATPLQISLLSALPALVTLSLALPTGAWLKNRPIDRVLRRSALIYRTFYLLWAMLPLFLNDAQQITGLLVITFVMSIPGMVVAISFNGLYADAVPVDLRGRIMSWRQAAYAITSILTSLLCGLLLDNAPFPQGYQFVFVIGFLGGMWSSWHLWQVKPIPHAHSSGYRPIQAWVRPTNMRDKQGAQTLLGLRTFVHADSWRNLLQLDVLRSGFLPILLLMFAYHFAQHLSIPLHPLRYVREMALSDGTIGVGNALFYGFVFLSATQYSRIEAYLQPRRTVALSIMLIAFYPGLLAFASRGDVGLFLLANVMGGSGTALSMGAIGNYLISMMPENDRPSYLAWYSVTLNAAILAGSLLAPVLSNLFGLTIALTLTALARFSSGLLLWRKNPS